MNSLKNCVEWKLTHSDKIAEVKSYPLIMGNCKKRRKMRELTVFGAPGGVGDMSRNIYCKNITYFLEQGWYMTKESAVITDKSISVYATKENSLGNLMVYLGTANQYAGKTLSMTYTAESGFVYTAPMGLNVRDRTTSTNVVDAKSVSWDGGYFSTVTIPEGLSDNVYLQIRIYGRNFSAGDEIKIDNIMIYEGDEPLSFEPNGKYKIPIVQKGKNVFLPGKVSASEGENYVLNNDCGTVLDSINLADGKVNVTQTSYDSKDYGTFSGGYFLVYAPGITVGKTYNVSFDVQIDSNPGNTDALVIWGNGVNPHMSGKITSEKQRVCFVTPLADVGSAAADNYFAIGCNGMSFTMSNFMITETRYNMDYEPYFEPVYHNIFMNSPIFENEYIDVKEKKVYRADGEEYIECSLPEINTTTTILETASSVLPVKMYGKYLRR